MNLLARPWPLFLLAVAVSLYRYWAWTVTDGISLSSEEALYWTWAQAPDWGYYSKPPMIAWLIHLAGELWASDAERVIKAIPLLLHPLTTLLVYALGRRLYDPVAVRHQIAESSAAFAALAGDYQEAEALRIQGSPTYILNDGRQKLFGNVGFRILEANIQELLRTPQPDQASWC